MWKNILEALLFLLGFGSILFLAFVTTKFIAGRSNRTMKGKYINIVETVSLGLDKKLYLVKVDRQFVLIASSGKTIEFLTNISLDEYEESKPSEGGNVFDFKAFFEKYLQSYKSKKDGEDRQGNVENSGSGTEGASVRNNVNRLKAIVQKGDNDVSGDGSINEK